MKKFAILGALALATTCSGCANLAQIETTATKITCIVSSLSSAAGVAESQVGAHQGITNTVTVTTANACAALKGVVQ